MNVLVLNAGSSTLKFQLIAMGEPEQRLWKGGVDRFGEQSSVWFAKREGRRQDTTASVPDAGSAAAHILDLLKSQGATIGAVGHRIVHGGEKFSESVLITPEVIRDIEACIDLAPLHNPSHLQVIHAARQALGEQLPQVAVFDTAFFTSLPEHAYLYALPYDFYRRHQIRRYGFHGTSHRYVSQRYAALRQLDPSNVRIITLHLGNGCSAAAIVAGRPIDTSMGMTPLEGLIMGTRSGDMDPAIVSRIALKEAMPVTDVTTLLNTQSGLLGISGLTNDMRILQQRAPDNPRARLAIDMFCYRARKYIGSFLAAMGGADAIVFTGGIGENSAEVRAQICQGLEWTGLRLDAERNTAMRGQEGCISPDAAPLRAYVIPTDEELLIARDTASLTRH